MTEATVNGARLSLVRGDISRQEVGAVVNAANSSLMGGGGVDGAIHKAGGPEILAECKAIVERQGRLPAGQAVITTAGRLPARYVIHTVGPFWSGGSRGEAGILASAYRESLRLAVANGVRTIAFPSISTGAYRYPVDQAARVALGTLMDFLKGESGLEEVRFVLFDARALAVYSEALSELAVDAG